MSVQQYQPSYLWRHADANTILAGNGPGAWLQGLRAKALNAASSSLILDAGSAVRLHADYSPNTNGDNKGLVVLLHGWLGCSRSNYILSAAATLFAQGYSVCRLHLRDHGPSAGLNKQPFLAIRLDEVLSTISAVQQQFPHPRNYLVGYSLGGNIAVRAAARLQDYALTLDKVVAVCPPVDPAAASRMISASGFYNRHFVGVWRRAFEEKVAAFPEFASDRDVFSGKDVMALHEAYVPRFSNYSCAEAYFKAYTLNAAALDGLEVETRIYMAADDPVIPIDSAAVLPELAALTLVRTQYGGHCGYLQDYRGRSWIDQELLRVLS